MDESHRRALGSGLRWVEHNLREIVQDLESEEGASEDGAILYRKMDDIKDEIARKVLATISSMLNEIALIKQNCKLETRAESRRKDDQSRLDEIWVVLEDLRPEKLDDFGKLSKADKDSLGERMQNLLKMVGQARDDLQQSWGE